MTTRAKPTAADQVADLRREHELLKRALCELARLEIRTGDLKLGKNLALQQLLAERGEMELETRPHFAPEQRKAALAGAPS